RGALEVLEHGGDVLTAGGVIEDAEPDREAAAQLRRGDESDVAAREAAHELGVHTLDAVLVGRAAHPSPEAKDAQRLGAHELELGAPSDALLGPLREVEAAVDRGAEGGETEVLHGEPHLDRVRRP